MRRWPRATRCWVAAWAPPRLSTASEAWGPPKNTSGEARGEPLAQEVGVGFGAHHDQAVDAAVEGAGGLGERVGIAVGAGDEQVEVVGAGRAVQPPEQLREKLAVEIGQQHADGVGLLGGQAAGGGVRHVAQPLGHLGDADARRLPHRPAVVVEPRDRRHRDARRLGDVAHRNGRAGGGEASCCNRLQREYGSASRMSRACGEPSPRRTFLCRLPRTGRLCGLGTFSLYPPNRMVRIGWMAEAARAGM